MCVRAPHGAQSEHTGHNEHADHLVEMFRQKFWGTLLLSIPTLVWAPMMQHWFGYTPPGGATASRWIPAFFGSLVFAYGGWVFIKAAAGEARLPPALVPAARARQLFLHLRGKAI
jgi:Cu2+-exporting ATPase